MSGEQFAQYLVTGLTVGAIYALIGLGFVTIHNVTGIVNFAQGEFVMLGALAAVTLHTWGAPLVVAFIGSVLIVSAIGGLIHGVAIRPARRASVLTLIIITIGISIALRGAALLVWGTKPYQLPAFTPGSPLEVLGARIVLQNLWVYGLTALTLFGIFLLFQYTMLGKALRACAINALAARLMSINPQTMGMYSFMLSAALGAIAGVVITPINYATYDMGAMLGLKGFVAAIMGGMVSAPAAVVGGLLLGTLEAFGAGVISSGYRDAISFVVLLVMLVVHPTGLLLKRRMREA